MKVSWSVGTKIGAGFGLALIILILIGATAYRSTNVLITNSRWVVHTDDVMVNLERLFSIMQDAETGQRGFVLTGAERYLAPYNDAVPRVQPAIAEIKRLTADNANQQRRIDALAPLIATKLSELQGIIDLRRQKGLEAAVAMVLTDQGKKTMDDIRSLIGEMEGEEKQLLQRRSEESEASAQSTRYTIVFGTLAAFVLLGITSLVVTRNIALPLQRVSRAAEAMAEGDLSVSLPAEARQDEVGVVTRTFARMAESLRDLAKAADRVAGGDLRVTVEPPLGQGYAGQSLCRHDRPFAPDHERDEGIGERAEFFRQ